MPPIFSPVVRPLSPIVTALNRAKNALYSAPQTTIQGVDENIWPSPLQPVTPMGPPKAQPLGWPFDWGTNIVITPRWDAEYSAAELRYLATYPLARVCIENNKDMITRMPHRIQLKPLPGETSKARAERSKRDTTLRDLNKFFDNPNPQQDWEQWLRPILEDMLVIDGACVFLGRNAKTGKLQELRYIEGASITVLVEEHGWTPPPPSPAYAQNWEGYPRIEFTTDQLIYRPRNIVPRNSKSSFLYGFSPTEQMATEIKIGMERLRYIFDFYKSGSVPGFMHFVPPNVSPDKIKEAQQYLDATYGGNLEKRRQYQLMQGWQETGHTEQFFEPKEPALADLFDEVHTRKICFAYGTSPQRLQRAMNRSSAQSAQESAEEEGTLPWMAWLKSFIDDIIQNKMNQPEYEFAFDPFHEMDRLKQSNADKIDVDAGLYTRNEARERRGDDPRPEPEADQLNVTTTMGVIPLGTVVSQNNAGETKSGRNPISNAPPPPHGVKVSGSNGHSVWATCKKHANSYPREFCSDCMNTEAAQFTKAEEVEQYV